MKRAAVATGLVLVTLTRAEVDCQLTPGGLCYRAEGSGPVVVLIHGFQMDLREWDEVAPIVAKSHRVVRYDLRGHGRSTVTDPFAFHERGPPRAPRQSRNRPGNLVGMSMDRQWPSISH
jgi:pimeloyl-ACP methyl ester carboxylesterase